LEHLHHQKKPAHTIRTYRSSLPQFGEFLLEKGIRFSQAEIDKVVVERFVASLKKKNLKNTTIDLRLNLLTYFFDFLKWLPNPGREVVNPEYIRNIPDVLTIEQVKGLLSLPSDVGKKGIRDKAILECLYYCLLTVGELTDLRLCDISLEENTVAVMSRQKRKERVIPLEHSAKEALARYLTEVRGNRGQDFLFLNFVRRGVKGITERAVERDVLEGYADQLNLQITPSTLRNSRAIHLLDSGVEVQSVLRLLGVKYPPLYMMSWIQQSQSSGVGKKIGNP